MAWESIDSGLQYVPGMVAATSYEITAGTMATPNGLLPTAQIIVTGLLMNDDGTINLEAKGKTSFVMQLSDLPQFAATLIETATPGGPAGPNRKAP